MNINYLSQSRPVILVIGSADIGGAEKQLVRLSQELKLRGVRVEVVFTQTGGPLTAHLDRSGVPWRLFSIRPRDNFAKSLPEAIRFARYLMKSRPLLINAWLPESTIIALTLARIFTPQCRRIASVRGDLSQYPRPIRAIFRLTFRAADRVICNSAYLSEMINQIFEVERSKIKVIQNGVDLPTEISDTSIHPPTAVVVANFHQYKGHETLLDALEKISIPLHVRLCGGGSARSKVADEIVRRNLGTVVTLVSEPADLVTELKTAQFAIHPSTTEGMSNAILEEMASGLPVVAFDIAGNLPIITHEENGLLAETPSPMALADAIDLLAGNSALRDRLSKEARKKAAEFDWNSSVTKYIETFEKVTEE